MKGYMIVDLDNEEVKSIMKNRNVAGKAKSLYYSQLIPTLENMLEVEVDFIKKNGENRILVGYYVGYNSSSDLVYFWGKKEEGLRAAKLSRIKSISIAGDFIKII